MRIISDLSTPDSSSLICSNSAGRRWCQVRKKLKNSRQNVKAYPVGIDEKKKNLRRKTD